LNGLLYAAYLSYLSHPDAFRPIYRAIRRTRPTAILELGIGDGQRAVRMLRLASLSRRPGEIRYTGLDRFEDRAACDGPGMTLKLAHRLLSRTAARIRLLPGEPLQTLGSRANDLGRFDVAIFSWRLDYQQSGWAWYFVPRLLDEQALVFREKVLPGGRLVVETLDRAHIDCLARQARPVKRRAA